MTMRPSAEKQPGHGGSWRVKAPGLKIVENATGNFQLNDSAGKTRFVIPDPIMWDSSGKPGVSEADTQNVDASVRQDGSDWIFTLSPDEAWLHSADRVYPVSVDPTTVGPYMANVHTYKSDGTHIADGQGRVGNSLSAGNTYWRTVLHYDYEQVFGKQVIGVWINGSYNNSGTLASYTGSVYRAASFSYAGAAERLSDFTVARSGNATDYALQARVAQLVDDRVSGAYFMIIGAAISGVYTYKNLNTAMGITYKDYPTAGAAIAPSPANGAMSPLMPKLKIAATDPEGTGLNYYYRISENANPDVAPVHNSGWVASAEYQVPAGALQAGKKYYWKGFVHDAYKGTLGISNNSPSAVWSFTTNTPAPTPAQSSAKPADGESWGSSPIEHRRPGPLRVRSGVGTAGSRL
ncbi:MAG: hypothetical protein ABIX44_10325 [Cryobacterium sp.]